MSVSLLWGGDMANREQFNLLRKSAAASDGMQEGNQWRKDHLDVKVNLSATLKYTNLTHATLSDADLYGSSFSMANFSKAGLSLAYHS